MSAHVTPFEALEDLVDHLAASGFTDRQGRPLETTTAFRNALKVLEDKRPLERASFAEGVSRAEDRSRH